MTSQYGSMFIMRKTSCRHNKKWVALLSERGNNYIIILFAFRTIKKQQFGRELTTVFEKAITFTELVKYQLKYQALQGAHDALVILR